MKYPGQEHFWEGMNESESLRTFLTDAMLDFILEPLPLEGFDQRAVMSYETQIDAAKEVYTFTVKYGTGLFIVVANSETATATLSWEEDGTSYNEEYDLIPFYKEYAR